jgi:hypothetical protein
VREALGRVSDAIGGLVSRLRRASSNRWFCDARVGGRAASVKEANKQIGIESKSNVISLN